jgi:hypothetical protein
MNKNYDAAGGSSLPLHCIVCDRVISDGNWFARIKLGQGRVAMCRPRCVEDFLDNREACTRKCSASHGDFLGYATPVPTATAV